MNSSSSVTIILDYSNIYLYRGKYNEGFKLAELVKLSKVETATHKIIQALINSPNGSVDKKKELLDVDPEIVPKRQFEINKKYRTLINDKHKKLIRTDDGIISFSVEVQIYDSISKNSKKITPKHPPN